MKNVGIFKGRKVKIPEGYRNALSSQLGVIEELLKEIESVLKEENFLFLKIERKIKKEKRKKIEEKIKELKKIISDMKRKFNLKEDVLTDVAVISSRTSKIWEILCDMKTEKMKRYGKIPDGLSDILDPLIDRMIKLIERIV